MTLVEEPCGEQAADTLAQAYRAMGLCFARWVCVLLSPEGFLCESVHADSVPVCLGCWLGATAIWNYRFHWDHRVSQ